MGEDIPTPRRMEAVKEGGSGEWFFEDLAIRLEKVSPAGGLAEGAMDPTTQEPEIIKRTVTINTADIISENAYGRSHELIKKVRIFQAVIWGFGRLSGAGRHLVNIPFSELTRRPE